MNNQDLGDTIRSLRLRKRLTLQQVSEQTNYSTSYLSQIERGRANPSIATLQTITQAMGEAFASLFQPEVIESIPDTHVIGSQDPDNRGSGGASVRENRFVTVVRKDQRKGLILPGNTYEQQLLSPDLKRRIEFLWTRIPSGTKTGVYQHEGEECGVILKGSLWVRVGDEEFTLNTGDSIYFYSSAPHGFENRGDEMVETIWVVTPPSF
jgi:transcriptional regulator with XRE-family HTH domain